MPRLLFIVSSFGAHMCQDCFSLGLHVLCIKRFSLLGLNLVPIGAEVFYYLRVNLPCTPSLSLLGLHLLPMCAKVFL